MTHYFYDSRMAIANAEGSTPSYFEPGQPAVAIGESGLDATWVEHDDSEGTIVSSGS